MSAMYRCQFQVQLLEILVCSYNTQNVLKEFLFLLIDATFTPKTLEHDVAFHMFKVNILAIQVPNPVSGI